MEQTLHTEAAAQPAVSEADFLRRTYFTLCGAIAAFIGFEVILFQTGIAQALAPIMTSNWLIVLGGFMVLGYLANFFARNNGSAGTEYFQLAVTIVLQGIIFIPLMVYAVYFSDISVLSSAVAISLVIFAGMTAIVAYSGKDFSFLGPFIGVVGIAALIAIVGAILLNVSLGFYFAIAMVVFAAGTILYETSNIIHRYGRTQHIAAATGLFASVALLFYYVLSAFISRD